jgi:hypothetical protein
LTLLVVARRGLFYDPSQSIQRSCLKPDLVMRETQSFVQIHGRGHRPWTQLRTGNAQGIRSPVCFQRLINVFRNPPPTIGPMLRTALRSGFAGCSLAVSVTFGRCFD